VMTRGSANTPTTRGMASASVPRPTKASGGLAAQERRSQASASESSARGGSGGPGVGMGSNGATTIGLSFGATAAPDQPNSR
jgi:hypothetical protein